MRRAGRRREPRWTLAVAGAVALPTTSAAPLLVPIAADVDGIHGVGDVAAGADSPFGPAGLPCDGGGAPWTGGGTVSSFAVGDPGDLELGACDWLVSPGASDDGAELRFICVQTGPQPRGPRREGRT